MMAMILKSNNTEEKKHKDQPMLKNQYGQYLLKVIDEMKNEVNSETFKE